MKAYIYKAALYCEDCAARIKTALEMNADNTRTPIYCDDSDKYPQGPLANGGGEADTPQHCDSCGVFLENVLTSDGDKYARDALARYELADNMSWEDIARAAEHDGKHELAQWARFYFAPGQ